MNLHLAVPWWRHEMETFSALLAICAGNSPVTGEFPTQRPVTRSVDVFFDLRLNKRLSKQWWCRWFETPSCPLWHHCNGWYISRRSADNQIYVMNFLSHVLTVMNWHVLLLAKWCCSKWSTRSLRGIAELEILISTWEAGDIKLLVNKD